MATRLITDRVWRSITATAKRHKGRSYVAVAYFGSGASKLLPLAAGSILVVDMSKAAVASGRTNPSEIVKLLKRGVNAYSVANLHAKVFVFDRKAYLGSSNVSQSSATGLVEAVVETTDRRLISRMKNFVKAQATEWITPKYAELMRKFYRPPKFGFGQRESPRSEASHIHSPVRIVQLVRVDLDSSDLKEEKLGLRDARERSTAKSTSQIDTFFWEGAFHGKQSELLIQVTRERNRRRLVSPPGRIIHIRRSRAERRVKFFVYLEVPKHLRRKNLKSIVEQLGPSARGKLRKNGLVRDDSLARELLRLWSSPQRT